MPTIDLGMGGDAVSIVEAPHELIDEVAWENSQKYLQPKAIRCLKKLKGLNDELEDEGQQKLF